MFDSWQVLALGLVSGFAFGFLLQKGQVTKFAVIVNQFLLRDFTVLKTMLTAIVVGGVGVYALHNAGMANLHVKPTLPVANVVGGLIFGVGMVLLGYCPGTALAAVVERSRHALVGVLGMVVGAVLLAETYGLFAGAVQASNFGELTLPSATGIPAWVYFAILGAGAVVLFVALERWERKRAGRPVQKPAEPPAPAAWAGAR